MPQGLRRFYYRSKKEAEAIKRPFTVTIDFLHSRTLW